MLSFQNYFKGTAGTRVSYYMYVKVVLDSCKNDVSEVELEKVCNLLCKYSSVFATSKDDFGRNLLCFA